MDAGRELDAEVAVKVLNQVICWYPQDIPDGWQLDIGQTLPGYRDGTFVYTLPYYSTSIAAAWLVVEHFTTESGHGCLHHFEMIYFAGESQWCVEIGGRKCGKPSRPYKLPQDLWAESLPLAICRAALAAVGAESR